MSAEPHIQSYAVVGEVDPRLTDLLNDLTAAFRAAGFTPDGEAKDSGIVINAVDPAAPQPFRRGSRGTFVAALYVQDEDPVDGLKETYPMLVRALANIVLLYVPGSGVYFTTMERGHYHVREGAGASLGEAVFDRLRPLATSRLVIDNEFRSDLEPELWDGDEKTEQMKAVGRRLDDLGLLPAPFPIEELLSERELRHVQRLYGIGGLSYGNLSARLDDNRFWMSASGVDKGKLETPGRDILLVTGYEPEAARMILSVPPGIEPRRVSVDAIEHWMIYQHHPDVGAILHIHAWMDGIPATDVNFPCGTAELANSVSKLIDAEPDPAHAVIGLRNHGITATGENLDEVLDRILPRLQLQVPMT